MTKVSIWDKVDSSLIRVAPRNDATVIDQNPASTPVRAPSWRSVAFHGGAIALWIYIFVQLFIVDVDRLIMPSIEGYRFLFFPLILVVIVIFSRRRMLTFWYFAFFPFVVVLFYFPRYLYKRKSWLGVFVVLNVVASVIKDFKVNVIRCTLWLAAVTVILTTRSGILLVPAMILIVGVFVSSLWRTTKYSLVGSRFVTIQRNLIERAKNSDWLEKLPDIAPELKMETIAKFDDQQLSKFTQNLGLVVLAYKVIYFWAYQLESYRKSALSLLFSLLSYLWLFVSSVLSFAALNLALFHLNPAEYAFKIPPGVLQFIYYSLSSFYLGTIGILSPVQNAALILKILAGFIGPVLFVGLCTNLIVIHRRKQEDLTVARTVSDLKERGESLKSKLLSEYEVSIEEALTRLEQLKYGLTPIIVFMSTGMPDDFQ